LPRRALVKNAYRAQKAEAWQKALGNFLRSPGKGATFMRDGRDDAPKQFDGTALGRGKALLAIELPGGFEPRFHLSPVRTGRKGPRLTGVPSEGMGRVEPRPPQKSLSRPMGGFLSAHAPTEFRFDSKRAHPFLLFPTSVGSTGFLPRFSASKKRSPVKAGTRRFTFERTRSVVASTNSQRATPPSGGMRSRYDPAN
jgi:hypothetical protein